MEVLKYVGSVSKPLSGFDHFSGFVTKNKDDQLIFFSPNNAFFAGADFTVF
jgi:hypothetical protein